MCIRVSSTYYLDLNYNCSLIWSIRCALKSFWLWRPSEMLTYSCSTRRKIDGWLTVHVTTQPSYARRGRLSPRSDPREIAPPPTVNIPLTNLMEKSFGFLDGSEQLSGSAAQNHRRENQKGCVPSPCGVWVPPAACHGELLL